MKIVLIVSFLMTSLALNAQTLQGKVKCIADGDTFTILDSIKAQSKVRFIKIDDSEKNPAVEEVSRKNLASMAAGNVVKVEWEKKYKHWSIPKEMKKGFENGYFC